MSERVITDPSQHGWVLENGKWVWDASGSGGGAGAGMVISDSEPTDKIEGMQWLENTTGKVWIWDSSAWFEFPEGKDGKDGADGADGVGGLWTDNGDTSISYNNGKVGIGGTPSRSTKEIEDEAVATLANWDSKDKKPTKAELIKQLTERNIGGGPAKLQVAGDAYVSGYVSTVEGYFRPDGTGSAGVQLWGQGTSYAEIQTFENGVGYTSKPLVINRQGGNVGIGGTPDGTISGGGARLQVVGAGYFTGTVYANGSPLTRAKDLIETLSTLRNATKDETVDVRQALASACDKLIEKFEAMEEVES